NSTHLSLCYSAICKVHLSSVNFMVFKFTNKERLIAQCELAFTFKFPVLMLPFINFPRNHCTFAKAIGLTICYMTLVYRAISKDQFSKACRDSTVLLICLKFTNINRLIIKALILI